MAYLAFNLNNGKEFVFELVEERLSLGRNPGNEIVIDNIFISKFHAELLRQADGNYELVDLKSSGGTFVNDARVDRIILQAGDRIRFGDLQGRYGFGQPAKAERREEGDVPALDEITPSVQRNPRNTESEIDGKLETPKQTISPLASVQASQPTPVDHSSQPPVAELPTSGVPDRGPIAASAVRQGGGLVVRLRLNRPPPALTEAQTLKRPEESLASPPSEATAPGLEAPSLVAKAPALAAAMDAGLAEQRARREEEGEARNREPRESVSKGVEPDIAAAVENTAVPAMPVKTECIAPTDDQHTVGETRAKVLAPENVPVEVTKAKFAEAKVAERKSQPSHESAQPEPAKQKSAEQSTRQSPETTPASSEESLGRLTRDLGQLEGRLSAMHHQNMCRTAHYGRCMKLLTLAILVVLAAGVFWIDQILPREVETRLAEFDGRRSAQARVEQLSPSASRAEAVVVNDAPPYTGTAPPLNTPREAPTSPPLGGDLSPAQRELVLLKERNRLTAYADEAIATGARGPYDRLWESFKDPRLADLVHAAHSEILRVQTAYLSGSRIDRFDIAVGEYFPEDRDLTDAQLKDGQLIKLLGDTAHPWQVRMKAANLLGARRSVEAGDALVHAVKTDPNLDVVKEATFSFDQMTGYHGRLFDAATLEQWWTQNKAKLLPPKSSIVSPAVKTSGPRAGTAPAAAATP